MLTVHSDNMTPETRELFRTWRRLDEEGQHNVFIQAGADTTRMELMERVEREMAEFLYRFFSPKPGERARSGLARSCRLARLMRDARLGKPDRLFS